MEDDQKEDDKGIPSFITPRGNYLTMESRNPYGHYFIKYTDGGELPDVLKGAYTGINTAVTAIQNYIPTITPLRAGGAEAIKEPPVLQLKPEEDQYRGCRKAPESSEDIPEESIFAEEPIEEAKPKPKPKKIKLTPPVKKEDKVIDGENLSS